MQVISKRITNELKTGNSEDTSAVMIRFRDRIRCFCGSGVRGSGLGSELRGSGFGVRGSGLRVRVQGLGSTGLLNCADRYRCKALAP
jgi:hypothetical protein